MCLGVPGKVMEIDGMLATVDFGRGGVKCALTLGTCLYALATTS